MNQILTKNYSIKFLNMVHAIVVQFHGRVITVTVAIKLTFKITTVNNTGDVK